MLLPDYIKTKRPGHPCAKVMEEYLMAMDDSELPIGPDYMQPTAYTRLYEDGIYDPRNKRF